MDIDDDAALPNRGIMRQAKNLTPPKPIKDMDISPSKIPKEKSHCANTQQ